MSKVKMYDFTLHNIIEVPEENVLEYSSCAVVMDGFLSDTYRYKPALAESCSWAKRFTKSHPCTYIVVTDNKDPRNTDDCTCFEINSTNTFNKFNLDKYRYAYAVYSNGNFRKVNWIENIALKNIPYCTIEDAKNLSHGKEVSIGTSLIRSIYKFSVNDNSNSLDLVLYEDCEEVYRTHTCLHKSFFDDIFNF